MINANFKAIKKVVIYYTDGTYQEVGNDNTYKPTGPYPYMPPTYPPGVPPTWPSPFTYSVPNHATFGTINDATCGAGAVDTTNRSEGKGKSDG